MSYGKNTLEKQTDAVMSERKYEQRRERLRALMRERGIDALLVSHAANRYYLSGFELHDPQLNESSGRLVVMADGKDWIATDSRYLDAARRLWDRERICIYGADAPEDIARLLLGLVPGKTVGFEARSVTLEFYERFSETLAGSGCRFARADGLVERLRVIKDEDEIRRMVVSCRLNQQLMEWLPGVLVPGRSEAAVAWDIEMFFRHNGATELAFSSIVGHGRNAALPHYMPSKDVLLEQENLVLVDVGCRLDEYCSDQTRTFWVGEKPTDSFKRTLDAVRTAQDKAIRAIHPGVLACDVYKVARAHFESLGVAEAFTHGLGHGVGLETHEGPSLNGRNTTTLEPGMIVTVEPGLYFPEWGGIRWEHMVLVTEDGCRVL